MAQLVIRGFEEFSPDPIEIIKSLNEKGYHWLTDFNSGNLLAGKAEGDPYIPYRIQLPSGDILDESEIYQSFDYLKEFGFSREEIQWARNLEGAVNHEDTNKDCYKFNEISFVSGQDKIDTIKKYSESPFYLEKRK